MGLTVPNHNLSLRQGAVSVFGSPGTVAHATLLNEFVKKTGLDPDVAWSQLEISERVVDALHEVVAEDERDDPNEGLGLTGQLSRAELDSFFHWVPCSVCLGARLGPHFAHFTLGALSFPEWASLPLTKCRRVGARPTQTSKPAPTRVARSSGSTRVFAATGFGLPHARHPFATTELR